MLFNKKYKAQEEVLDPFKKALLRSLSYYFKRGTDILS